MARRRTGVADPWRPTKLTPAVTETILLAVRGRNHLETAASLAGVSVSTVREWAREGARLVEVVDRHPERKAEMSPQERRLVDFSAALVRAHAEGEARSVAIIGSAASEPAVISRQTTKVVGVNASTNEPIYATETMREERPPDWKAEAFRLERRYPSRWGPTMRQEVTGAGGGPVVITVDALMAKWAAAREELAGDNGHAAIDTTAALDD